MFGFSYPGQTYPAGYPPFDIAEPTILAEDDEPITGARWATVVDGQPWAPIARGGA